MSIIKIMTITVIILTMGLVVLPSTVNLFAGGHSFYNVNQGYGSRCIKCHADVHDELKAGANHSTVDGSEGWSGEECLGCHRANVSITFANTTANVPGEEAHAATIIDCGYCHLNSTNPFNAPVAGGFGLSDLGNDTGYNASHYSFMIDARDSDLLKNESEPCVACHTNTRVRIEFSMRSETKLSFKNSLNASDSYWDLENMVISENTTYTEVKE
ncbi:MAG: hypothetical protein R6U44_05875 [Archaeoglobaceae archaeon]